MSLSARERAPVVTASVRVSTRHAVICVHLRTLTRGSRGRGPQGNRGSGTMPGVSSSLTDVLATLRLERVNAAFFVGEQLPAPANHILGGHIAAQALMAASTTTPGRTPHSMHTYFLRPGDARQPVDFEVVELQEGRSFSARRVTARQDGQVLLEALSSFRSPTEATDVEYQPPMPAVPEPESLPCAAPHFMESDGAGQ